MKKTGCQKAFLRMPVIRVDKAGDTCDNGADIADAGYVKMAWMTAGRTGRTGNDRR